MSNVPETQDRRNATFHGCLPAVIALFAVVAIVIVLVALWPSGGLLGRSGCAGPLFYGLGDNFDPYVATRSDFEDALPKFGPHWTPDGSRIVFAIGDKNSSPVEGMVYVAASDGSALWAITNGFGESALDHSPDLSNDGSRIVYSTYNAVEGDPGYWGAPDFKRHFAIETADLGGSNRKRLTSDDALDHSPTWSPDGTQVAFLRSRCYFPSASYRPEVLVANADGSRVRRIIKGFDRAGYIDEINYVGGLTWSPDGQLLAFTTENWEISSTMSTKIRTVKPDGSDACILHDMSGAGNPISSIAWSPDGRRIAFVAMDTVGAKVFSIDQDSGDREILMDLRVVIPVDDVITSRLSRLLWSPDMTQILFSLRSGYDGGTIYVADTSASRVTELTKGFHAAWSPDGSKIAVVHPDSDDIVLHLISPDGSDLRPLVRRTTSGGIKRTDSVVVTEDVEILEPVGVGTVATEQ